MYILRCNYVLQDEQHLIKQSELHDLFRNSNFSKQQAKLAVELPD